MSSTPLVSVIVPAYNFGHLIAQTIESVQAQTYRHWECLVIDDGSTDETRSIINALAAKDARIKYFRQSNQGLSAARNSGIRLCAGEYVQFLDADDMIEARKLELQVQELERDAEVDVIYGNVRYFRSESPLELLYSKREAGRTWMPEVSGTGTEILRAMVSTIIMPINAPVIKKTVFARVGFFDESLRAMEDWDFWRRCAVAGVRFRYQDFPGTLALVRDQPLSMSKDRARMTQAFQMVQEKMFAEATDEETHAIYQKMAAQMQGSVGVWAVEDGQRLKGMRHLWRAGMMSGSVKWFAYALMSAFVPGRKFEKAVSFSFNNFGRRSRKI